MLTTDAPLLLFKINVPCSNSVVVTDIMARPSSFSSIKPLACVVLLLILFGLQSGAEAAGDVGEQHGEFSLASKSLERCFFGRIVCGEPRKRGRSEIFRICKKPFSWGILRVSAAVTRRYSG